MKKSWIRFLAFLLIFALPIVAIGTVVFALPAQFEETFLGEFDRKVERLYAAEGEKIIFVGGSSLAFGLDAKLLSETLQRPVINFGLYATLGTKVMLDYSKKAIEAGDIVVLAPEMNAQTWSLYFNAEAMWQAVDGHFGLLRYLDSENVPAMLGGVWKFAASKLKYMSADMNDLGIYSASSFDDYGFIRYNRDKDYNTMTGGVDAGMPIDFDTAMIAEDFIEYVNDYIAYAQKKGATVYLSACPMNEAALAADLTMEDLEAYVAFLNDNFDCEILGDPNNMIYRTGYFYDSNFHLNSAGATVHTRQLALDLAPILGIENVDIEIPDVPEIPAQNEDIVYDYDENEKYFTYEVTDFGVNIIGLSEEGKNQTVLRTPVAYDGKKVVQIKADAFNGGGNITELFVTDNIGQIANGAFRGADSLVKIHILATDPDMTKVDSLGDPHEGLPANSYFYVPADAFGAYFNNYFWGPHSDYIKAEE
jgi:hypothetical protein